MKYFFAFLVSLFLFACSGKEQINTSINEGGITPHSDSNQIDNSNYINQSNLPPESLEYFAQTIGNRVHFDYDQYTLDGTAQQVLESQAQWIKKYANNVTIVVEGHADERGTREYNIALGARRANSTKKFLVSQGIPSNQIRTVSYGKERPMNDNSNETAWAENRRTVTVLK